MALSVAALRQQAQVDGEAPARWILAVAHSLLR
jgi:hypothetical protein